MIATIILFYIVLTKFFKVDKEVVYFTFIFFSVLYLVIFLAYFFLAGGIDSEFALFLVFI
jgi:hypothetical protein